jgi:Uma2 family endonuclease
MIVPLTPAVASIFADSELDANLVFHVPRDAHTLAGFRRWVLSDEFPEKQPVLFLRGEIYLFMPKEDVFTHAAVKTAVSGCIYNLNQELDLGDFYINGILVSNVEADLSGNPDMVGILWESLDSGKVRYVQNAKGRAVEVEGSPDWVLEIVSDNSVKKDKRDLRDAYHKAGVNEYWIIDARGEEIEFQILNWRKTGYVAANHKAGWHRSRVFGRSFRLTRKRDRRGAWRYALEVSTDQKD